MPLQYHPDYDNLGERICDAIATSPLSLNKICAANPDFPDARLVYYWLRKYPDFKDKYYKAREAQAECIMQYITDLTHDDTRDTYTNRYGEQIPHSVAINRDRLRIDNLRFQAQKMNNRYSEKQVVEQHNFSHEDSLRELS